DPEAVRSHVFSTKKRTFLARDHPQRLSPAGTFDAVLILRVRSARTMPGWSTRVRDGKLSRQNWAPSMNGRTPDSGYILDDSHDADFGGLEEREQKPKPAPPPVKRDEDE